MHSATRFEMSSIVLGEYEKDLSKIDVLDLCTANVPLADDLSVRSWVSDAGFERLESTLVIDCLVLYIIRPLYYILIVQILKAILIHGTCL